MKRILNHIVQNAKMYVRSNFVHPKPLVNAGFLLLMILIAGVPVKTRAQALYSQDFNFTGTLTSNGWTAHSGGGTNALSTTTGLTYNGHAGSGIGNAALVNNLGGEDANQTFTSQNINGQNVYYSFLVNVTDVSTAKTGDYFLNVGSPGGAAWTAYSGRVFARIVSGNVNFGISNTGTATYGTTNFSKNTTYLIVVKHTIVTGVSADPLSMWVIPSGMPATEAAAGTAEVVNSATNGTDAISAVALRQGSATTSPQVVVDAIRVGANWSDVVPQAGSAPTAQVSNITFSSPTSSSVSVSWTNGNGTGRIVKINTSNSFTAPVSGTTYTGNAVYGGSGEQVVYAGTGSSFSLSGLSPGQAYFLRAYEYNSTGMLYNLFSETNNPNSTTLSYPVPTATQITPNSAFAGASSFSLTFNGTNVYPASVIEWNGVAKTTSYVNSTTLTATIPASDIASAGTATVTVRNPAPGGGVSSGLTFTINASTTPLISVSATLSNFISPAGTPSASQSYTVAGSNLTDGITITPPAGFEIRTGIDSFSIAPITLPLAGSNYPTSFTVEVDQKDASHPNFGIGYPSGYILNSVQGPTLTLVRGTTYRFYFDGQGTCCSSTLGHPFVFTSSAVGGGANSGDVISAGVIQYGDSTYFTPDVSTPDSLYYMCDVHQSMGGSINVINPTAGSISATTIDVRFNPGASGTYSGNIDHSSTGATTENVAVTGFAIESEPTNSSAISFGAIDGNSIVVNTSGGNGSARIIVIRSASATTYTPSDGAAVNGVNANFTTALDQGSGNKIVYDGSGNTVTVTGLSPLTTYHFSVFEYNGSGVTSNYLGTASTANATTLVAEPSTSATVSITRIKADTAVVGMASGNGAGRMIVISTNPVSFVPADGSVYTGASGNLATASNLGSGNYLLFNGAASTPFIATGLISGTTYYVRTYEYNGSGSGINYRTSTFGSATFTMPSNILYNGGTYTQDFNGLPSSGTSFGMTGFGLGPYYLSTPTVNATNLAGWQHSSVGGSGVDVVFAVDNGSSGTGGAKSYGSTASANRALGSLATGTSVPVIGAVFINNTSGPLNKVTINYTGQQWRNGGSGTPNLLNFAYQIGGTDIVSGNFTSQPTLNFQNPISGGTAINLDGTLPANQTALSSTFNLNANWMPGQTLVIRWTDNNDAGNDEGLAIDDLSFSAQGPSTPLLQDSLITFANVLTTSMDVNWTAGDANNRIVVINTTNSFTPPVDGNNYTANAVYSGSGEQVVYNGTGNVVSVSGLTAGTTYYFRVFGYNGSGASSKYSTSTAQDNPLSQTTAAPSAATKLVITSVNGGNYPVDNTPFNVIVQAQDSAGSPQTVSVNTTVSLSVFSGFGILGGNTTGVINAGSSTVTITGVTYTPEDFAVQLQADAVSGETLASGFSSIFDVLGVATQLSFTTTPPAGIINNAVTSIEVTAFRTDFTTDVNYTSAVTLTKLSGPGNITGTTTVNCVAGVATFSGISFDQPGAYVLQASSGSLTAATSTQIIITLNPVMTELVVPKYITAKTATGAHNARIPFAVCLKIDNLVPNTAYDIKAGVGLAQSDINTTYGSGNTWLGTLFGIGNIPAVFTTDANGSSGPFWVYIQPTGSSTNSRFAADSLHNLRIGFVQSGGVMPLTPNFVGSKLIRALDVATTPYTASTTDDGAFLTGTSSPCLNGKYILVYDNEAGTGDPLYSYQARQMAATNTSQSDLPTALNDILTQAPTSPLGDYAALIPIGANNPNGVRRIEARNADNTTFNAATDADGVWAGGINTTNIVRRSVATLTATAAPLNTLSITASATGESCTGANDGTATATVVTGVAPITYSWNSIPVQTAATATGLPAGIYTVTVTDGSGCSQQATVTVAAPASTTITASGPLTFCSGGSVTLTVNAAESYLWSNGATTQSVVISISGNYVVTVVNGTCTATSLPVTVTAQDYSYTGTMYSENIGTPGGTTPIATFTGWQNGLPVIYSTTSPTLADIRATTASSGYTGASGGGNIYFGASAAAPARNFIVSGINTQGYSSMTLSFGLKRDAASADLLALEYSTDGTTWTPLSITVPSGTTWTLVTASGTIPATSNLRLRFSKNSAVATFRIDDIKITGNTNTAAISTSGPTAVCGAGSVYLLSNIPSGITWSTGATTRSIQVSAAGTYSFTATDGVGCQTSSSGVAFTVNPEPTASVSSGTIACNGGTTSISVTAANGTDPYSGTGNFTVGAGTYSYIVTDANGCDDTTGVTITQPALITGSQAASACDSYVWSLNGQTYTTSGNYNTIVPAANGCDSVVTLQLIITPSTTNSTSASACDAYTWSYNGQTYTTSGSYTSVTGCHTEILNLTINPSSLNVVSETACGSYTWALNGQTYTASGSYTSVTGCNTEVLNLTINAVSVNTDTVIVCTSYTWAANGQTYTQSGNYTSVSGCNTEILDLTIQTCGNVTLNLSLLIEGYYDGNGGMVPVLFNSGVGSSGTETDTIMVELRDPLNTGTIVASASAVINTSGLAVLTYPLSVSGSSYYIAVNHRNAVQTWSADPVLFGSNTSYNFSTAATQAYGSNMKEVSAGVFAFYSGDIAPQDGVVDITDQSIMDNDIFNFGGGYMVTDVSGDGVVDITDQSVLDNNIFNFVGSFIP